MMPFVHWDFIPSYQCYSSEQGGITIDLSGNFSNASDILKERLTLDKRSQHLFKAVLRRCTSTCYTKATNESCATPNYARFGSDKLRGKFYLEILTPRGQLTESTRDDTHKCDTWKLERELRGLDSLLSENFFKERVKLDTECRKIFKELQRKVSLSSLEHFPPFQFNDAKDSRLKSFLVGDIAKRENKAYRKNTSFTTFISKVEEAFTNLLEEGLSKNVHFLWVPQPKTEITAHISRDYHNFLIDERIGNRINFTGDMLKEKWRSEVKNGTDYWVPTPISEEHVRASFLTLENSLFDTEFHKLELYKLPIKVPKLSKGSQNIKRKRHFGKIVWKLDKDQLKLMSWNPFKGVVKFASKTCFPWYEKIKQEHFSVKVKERQFIILRCSDLDLIDATTKNFGTFKVGLNANLVDQTIESDPADTVQTVKIRATDKNTDCEIVPMNQSTTFTRSIINTSLVPQKRSFLDDELWSIVETKKNQIREMGRLQGESRSSDSRSTLQEDYQPVIDSLTLHKLNCGFYNTPLPLASKPTAGETDRVNEGGEGAENFGEYVPTGDFEAEGDLLSDFNLDIGRKTIILNAAKLEENHSLLNSLVSDGFGMDILERDLGPNAPCDFIINFCTCLLRVKLSLFQQFSSNGKLYYEEPMLQLLKSFQKVVVLVEHSAIYEDVDPDIFWKLRLFLAYDSIELHFVSSEASLLVWIKYYTSLFGSEVGETELESESISTDDKEVLHAMGFSNPFLLQKLLTEFTLPHLLQLVQNSTIKYLTPYQHDLLSLLVESNW